ncbi:MAG: 3-oxoacyl-[acyl-carrier-protein] reductase [Armatimonadetes bacterium]|nr:3-oxoacyl-[acyl-carrier-protein] reductase [Armatimonadota bacterium]
MNPSEINLSGKVALVTGGSGAIGGAICLDLARAGARVVVHYGTNRDAAERVAEAVRAGGGEAVTLGGDVCDEAAVEHHFEEARRAMGTVNILVNNAGALRDNLVIRLKLDDWQRVVDTNLTSTFLCTRVAVRDMLRARWGRIINITSVVAEVGNAGQSNYVASKAGVIGFTRSVAREVASRSITVNAVAPGYVNSRMTADLNEKQQGDLKRLIPMGRVGAPEDIAPAVTFLASDEAAYITGQVLNVDGGMVMK